LKPVGPHRVLMAGARGRPPTSTYKVCVIYEDGWRAAVLQPIMGMDAAAKAEHLAASLITRTRDMLRSQNLGDWKKTHVEVLGTEATYGAHARMKTSREVICRIVVDHDEKRAVDLFALEQISTITSMSVGTTIGLGTAVTPIQNLFSFLLPKDQVSAAIRAEGVTEAVPVPTGGGYSTPAPSPAPPAPAMAADMVSVPLIDLAWGRSGDKGDLFNVAVIARRPEYLPYIRAALSPASVATWFAHAFTPGGATHVDRHEAPGIDALNFVVHNALDGGITSSPRVDRVAKTMAQQLLEFPVSVPRRLVAQKK
jgi:hypothetical protein